MLGSKLQREGVSRAFLGGLAALALITTLGLTPALAKHHGNHGNHGNQGHRGDEGGGGGGGGSGGSGQFDVTSFSGRYTTAYHSFDASITGTTSEPNPPATPIAVSGSITSNGDGTLKGGTLQVDFGAPGTGAAATCTETGTYTVTPDGQLTLNLVTSCTTVTCTLVSGAPSCSSSGSPSSTPTQWFCSLSGPEGKTLVCTEMGEAASGTTFQTPISAVTWVKGHAPAPPPSDDNDGDTDNGGDD